MNSSLTDISARQLNQAAKIKERIEELEGELGQIFGTTSEVSGGGKNRMSAAGRAAIAAGARARWAKYWAANPKKQAKAGRRTMSAAVKARLSAIAKARWKKAKSAGKSAL
jgi:hypothetical protein